MYFVSKSYVQLYIIDIEKKKKKTRENSLVTSKYKKIKNNFEKKKTVSLLYEINFHPFHRSMDNEWANGHGKGVTFYFSRITREINRYFCFVNPMKFNGRPRS